MFPATTLQTCIVHLIRNSLDYASWKERRELAAAIRPIYTAPSTEAAQDEADHAGDIDASITAILKAGNVEHFIKDLPYLAPIKIE